MTSDFLYLVIRKQNAVKFVFSYLNINKSNKKIHVLSLTQFKLDCMLLAQTLNVCLMSKEQII